MAKGKFNLIKLFQKKKKPEPVGMDYSKLATIDDFNVLREEIQSLKMTEEQRQEKAFYDQWIKFPLAKKKEYWSKFSEKQRARLERILNKYKSEGGNPNAQRKK